jgi:pentatricopeptide repeat protein
MLISIRNNTEKLEWEEAMSMLQHIPADAKPEWLPTYRAVLNCCCRAMRYNEAQSVWRQLPSRDVMSYNSMLGMCGRLQRPDEVESLLKQMDAEGIQRTGVTYCHLMSSCAESQQWQKALQLLEELKSKPELDVTTNWDVAYLMPMTACARAGQHAQVRSLLEELSTGGKGSVNNAHYNALLVSCGTDGPAAKKVFEEMKAAGFAPRGPDYRALMSVWRVPEEQHKIYAEMLEECPSASLEEAWTCMLRTAVTSGDVDAAEWVFQEMRRRGVDPNSPEAEATPSLRRVLRTFRAREVQMRAKATSLAAPTIDRLGGAQTSAPTLPPAPSSLPQGWASAVDPASGKEYYWQVSNPTSTTTWERPA